MMELVIRESKVDNRISKGRVVLAELVFRGTELRYAEQKLEFTFLLLNVTGSLA